MNNNLTAQNSLDKICYQRIQSSNFAQKPKLKSRIIRWMKGGAK